MRKVPTKELLRKIDRGGRKLPAPYDQQLRRAILIGGISAAAAIPVSLFFVPVLSSWAYSGFFWFLGNVSVTLLALLSSPVGVAINLMTLLGTALLWYLTDGLRSAPISWHRVGFGLSAVGAVDLAIVGMPVLIVALNVVVWIAVIALAIVAFFAVLAVMGAMARS